ncbi:MAG: PulJ/GspJ family protein [Brevirhabdus sp.]
MDAGIGSGQSGFTLIELLIVITVLAVLSIGASLSLTSVTQPPMAHERWIKAVHEFRQLSVLERQAKGMFIYTDGWKAARPAGDGLWVATGELHPWESRVRLQGHSIVEADYPRERQVADLVFLPDGRTSAFDIRFELAGGILRCGTRGGAPMLCKDVE